MHNENNQGFTDEIVNNDKIVADIEIKDHSFLKNVGWLTLGKLSYLLLSFIVTLTVIRYLGPYDFGTINYVDAYIKIAHVIATLGLDAIIVKEVAGGKKDSNTIVWTALLIRLVLGTLLGIAITFILFITDGGDPVIIKIAILESLFLVFAAFHSFFDYFQASMQSKWNAMSEVIAYLGTSLFRVVLLVIKADVVWFAFANALDMMIIAFFLGSKYFRVKGFKPFFDRNVARSLLSQSWYYMVSGLLTVAFTQIDRIMIEKLLDRTSLGEYSVSTNFASVWALFSSVLTQTFLPVIYQAFQNNKKKYLRRIRQSYAAIFWLNMCFAIFVCVFARQIVDIMYGEAYLGVVPTLRIVVWYYGASTMSLITQAYLSNKNKSYYVVWICIIGVLLDIALNTFFIPRLGIEGAAVSTLITQIVIQFVIPFVITDIRECSLEMMKGTILWKVLDKDERNGLRDLFKSITSKSHGKQ